MKEERRDENLAAKIVRNFAYLDAVWSFLLAVADGASLSSGGPPVPFTARFAVFLDSFCGALAGVFLLYAVAEGVQILHDIRRAQHPISPEGRPGAPPGPGRPPPASLKSPRRAGGAHPLRGGPQWPLFFCAEMPP